MILKRRSIIIIIGWFASSPR